MSFPLLQQVLSDGGPLYTETNLDNFIAEPWNAASAILFLLIVGYWFWKLKGEYRQYLFITVSMIILAIGGVGGMLYHGLRVSQIFLVMDWLPIMMLTLAGSGFFIYVISRTWWHGLVWIGFMFVLMGLNYQLASNEIGEPGPNSINFGYFLMAMTVLLPTLVLLYRTKFKAFQWVLLSLFAFSAALFFRISDDWGLLPGLLPMGTHFLWHTFGALACHGMFQYAYQIYPQPAEKLVPNRA